MLRAPKPEGAATCEQQQMAQKGVRLHVQMQAGASEAKRQREREPKTGGGSSVALAGLSRAAPPLSEKMRVKKGHPRQNTAMEHACLGAAGFSGTTLVSSRKKGEGRRGGEGRTQRGCKPGVVYQVAAPLEGVDL